MQTVNRLHKTNTNAEYCLPPIERGGIGGTGAGIALLRTVLWYTHLAGEHLKTAKSRANGMKLSQCYQANEMRLIVTN